MREFAHYLDSPSPLAHRACLLSAWCVHRNDYWTSTTGGCPIGNPADPEGRHSTLIVDLWQNNLDTPGVQGPAHGYNNSCSPKPDRTGLACTTHGPKADKLYGGYEDSLFAQHVLRTVAKHDSKDPYFLFW